jgi:hypothetical protein
MPCSGSLFTSMTPLFPCFLMGLLSAEGSKHRQFVLNWFGTVMGANQCRSVKGPRRPHAADCTLTHLVVSTTDMGGFESAVGLDGHRIP